MSTKGALQRPARLAQTVRLAGGEFESVDFARARDKRRKAAKLARQARRKQRK